MTHGRPLAHDADFLDIVGTFYRFGVAIFDRIFLGKEDRSGFLAFPDLPALLLRLKVGNPRVSAVWQAEDLSKDGFDIRSYVLDVSLS